MVAYMAYAKFTGGKTYDDKQMPQWQDLPKRIQDAWRAAIGAVLDEYSHPIDDVPLNDEPSY